MDFKKFTKNFPEFVLSVSILVGVVSEIGFIASAQFELIKFRDSFTAFFFFSFFFLNACIVSSRIILIKNLIFIFVGLLIQVSVLAHVCILNCFSWWF